MGIPPFAFWRCERSYLLFRLNVALADNSLFCFFLSPSLSLLVALAVITFSLCRPPCWTEVQASPPLFSVKALSHSDQFTQCSRTPVGLFFFFNCVVFVYYLDTGNLEARALHFVPRLSSSFHVPGSLVTPCAHDLFPHHCS